MHKQFFFISLMIFNSRKDTIHIYIEIVLFVYKITSLVDKEKIIGRKILSDALHTPRFAVAFLDPSSF